MIRFVATGSRRSARPELSAEYRRYLESIAWEKRRARALELAGHRCQECDATDRLEVHHLTYDRLFEEHDDDLRVLCHLCHRRADTERRNAATRVRYDRRLDAWASKVYGEEWWLTHAEADVAEAFDRWLERKGE